MAVLAVTLDMPDDVGDTILVLAIGDVRDATPLDDLPWVTSKIDSHSVLSRMLSPVEIPYTVNDFANNAWLATALMLDTGGTDMVDEYIRYHPSDLAIARERAFIQKCMAALDMDRLCRYDASDVDLARDEIP
nr:hypothetical protein TetV2_00408 [Oceanusvirus sp.]